MRSKDYGFLLQNKIFSVLKRPFLLLDEKIFYEIKYNLKGKLQAFQSRIAVKTEVLRGNRSVMECQICVNDIMSKMQKPDETEPSISRNKNNKRWMHILSSDYLGRNTG